MEYNKQKLNSHDDVWSLHLKECLYQGLCFFAFCVANVSYAQTADKRKKEKKNATSQHWMEFMTIALLNGWCLFMRGGGGLDIELLPATYKYTPFV